MPELPDVEYMRRRLRPARGKAVRSVRVYDRSFIRLGQRRAFAGSRISSIVRRGKFIAIELNSGRVFIAHMGMTGDLALHRGHAPLDPHIKCSLILSDNMRIDYVCTRKLGMFTAVRRDRLDRVPLFARLGPEPLELSEKEFLELLSKGRGRIKPFLMNQRRIAGLGNLCADEILFRARIHPLTRLGSLRPPQRRALYRAMRRVLSTWIAHYGKEMTGKLQFIDRREEGAPCPRCKTKIRRIVADGRGTYFCPACQRR